MADALLPSAFAELEPYADAWCLPTESERWDKRMASTMIEMREFHEAFFPRLEEAIEYCDKFPLDDMPADALNLLYLLYSMVMVSFPVECWGQARVPDTGAAYLDLMSEPGP